MHTYSFPHPAVAADIAAFTVANNELHVLLVKRGENPFQGAWALPGGFLRQDETLEAAACRELLEETGVESTSVWHSGLYSDPGRDPRQRVISVAYTTILEPTARLSAGTDAAEAGWHPINALPPLAFDHSTILAEAHQRAIRLLREEPVALKLLPPRFTLAQLQSIYEAIEGRELDKRNFRSFLQGRDWVRETSDYERGRHRPARLFEASELIA